MLFAWRERKGKYFADGTPSPFLDECAATGKPRPGSIGVRSIRQALSVAQDPAPQVNAARREVDADLPAVECDVTHLPENIEASNRSNVWRKVWRLKGSRAPGWSGTLNHLVGGVICHWR